MNSDLQIAQSAKLRPIVEIAEELGLGPDDFDTYGSPYIANSDSMCLIGSRTVRTESTSTSLR
jgi:formyltetrahydrofolate synthetase